IDLPTAVAPDGAGGFYVTVTGQNRVYRVSAAGVVSVIAGTSSWGYSGDGGRAVAAQLRNPRGIAVDGAGNLFIADTVNNRIRKVDPSGVISTLAGSGAFG